MSLVAGLSLREVSTLLHRRDVSSVEVTQACLHAIGRLQPTLQCYIDVNEEEALASARCADVEIAAGRYRGDLHGVPLAHKDLFLRTGKISTAGSRILRDHVGTETAAVMTRLENAGAIDLGTLNMAEFAGNPTGHNPHYGDCRNPWNPDRISGGSSSGSAVAVAARTCYGSLGSDTGGSVRTPAAINGVCGLKPTYGRISRRGVFPRAWSLDTVGIVARTAEDCALLTQVVAGHDPLDASSADMGVSDFVSALTRPIHGLRLGIPPDSFVAQAQPRVREAWERHVRELVSLGAKVTEVPVPELSDLAVVADAITKCEAAALHDQWLRSRGEEYSLFVRSRIEAGFHIPAVRYLQAMASRAPVLRAFVDRVFAVVDILHTPVIPISAPRLVDADPNSAAEVPEIVGRMTAFVRPFSYLGLPAIAVPGGFDPDGMPTAFQLVAQPFAEALLLNVTYQYQQAFEWHRRMPALVEREAVSLP